MVIEFGFVLKVHIKAAVLEKVLENIKVKACCWLRQIGKGFNCSFLDWCREPRVCMAAMFNCSFFV